MRTLLFDTNFFRGLVEKQGFFEKVYPHLKERYGTLHPNQLKLFVSPFAFLEYLGIKIEPPVIPSDLIGHKALDSFNEAVGLANRVFDYAYEYYDQNDKLAPKMIEETLNRRRQHVLPKAEELWNTAVSSYSKPEFRKVIIDTCAFDCNYRLNLNKGNAAIFHAALWIDAARKISEGMDICLFRTVKWRWEAESRSQRVVKFEKTWINRLYKSMRIKSKGDLVDAELVHYIIFGKFIGKSLCPVDAYTCDPPQKIKDRIGIFHSGLIRCIEEVNQIYEAYKGKLELTKFPDSLKMGSVTFYSATGDINEGPIPSIDCI